MAEPNQHRLATISLGHTSAERLRRKLQQQAAREGVFDSLALARKILGRWRHDYNNHQRPHMTHNGQSPFEFARNVGLCHGGKVKIAAGF
jgi:putative transposase